MFVVDVAFDVWFFVSKFVSDFDLEFAFVFDDAFGSKLISDIVVKLSVYSVLRVTFTLHVTRYTFAFVRYMYVCMLRFTLYGVHVRLRVRVMFHVFV